MLAKTIFEFFAETIEEISWEDSCLDGEGLEQLQEGLLEGLRARGISLPRRADTQEADSGDQDQATADGEKGAETEFRLREIRLGDNPRICGESFGEFLKCVPAYFKNSYRTLRLQGI